MCLAVPGRIVSIAKDELLTMAEVDFHGVRRQVCIDTVDAQVGDYIVAHAGVAVSVMDADTAIGALHDLELMTRHSEENEH
ncbi:MAG: HypC/HybG/HupF family hydrogenase formation chaperone [Paramuribaculum sp.]|nr:HypC/HybG/HupF family hydrogenase formation chaperone [Barnesiella sp.]MDE7449247.1 HypC/HybG/HupF family hydrogenase formation chaperone [Paramuribaculum sp.]